MKHLAVSFFFLVIGLYKTSLQAHISHMFMGVALSYDCLFMVMKLDKCAFAIF